MNKLCDVMLCMSMYRTACRIRSRLGEELRELSGEKWWFCLLSCEYGDSAATEIGAWKIGGDTDNTLRLTFDGERCAGITRGDYSETEVQEVVSIVEGWLASESKGVLE